MKIKIKYFENAVKLNKIEKGNWIDVYAREDVFIPISQMRLVPLGFALEMPKGYEGHLAPRSSTFKTWGVIQTNGVGVIDESYSGDNDEWKMPLYCLQHRDDCELVYDENRVGTKRYGTWIRKGDKVGQFRIMETMKEIEFEEVAKLENEDRGGFGSTGKN